MVIPGKVGVCVYLLQVHSTVEALAFIFKPYITDIRWFLYKSYV